MSKTDLWLHITAVCWEEGVGLMRQAFFTFLAISTMGAVAGFQRKWFAVCKHCQQREDGAALIDLYSWWDGVYTVSTACVVLPLGVPAGRADCLRPVCQSVME